MPGDKLEFALWPIAPFGGDPDRQEVNSDQNNSSDSDGDSDSNANSNGTSQGSDSGSTETSGDANGSSDEDDDEDEFAGLSAKDLRKRLRDAKRSESATKSQLTELQKKIEEAERKELSELEAAKKDLEKLRKADEQKAAIIEKQALMQGILLFEDITFHNPKDVLAFINREEITINDDGEAEGLIKQLKELAKEKPYLVKSTKKDKGDGSGGNNAQGRGSTGSQPGQGVRGKTDPLAKQRNELAKLYPALSSR